MQNQNSAANGWHHVNYRSDRYEQAQFGDTLHYFGGWVWHVGTVVWIEDWRTDEYGQRERLAVVARTDGGLDLIHMQLTPREYWHTQNIYTVDRVLTTWENGTAADVDEFLRRIREQAVAYVSLDTAIAQSAEDKPYGK